MCYHNDDRFVANVFGSGGVAERVESLGQIGSRRGHARHLYDNQFISCIKSETLSYYH